MGRQTADDAFPKLVEVFQKPHPAFTRAVVVFVRWDLMPEFYAHEAGL